MIAAFGLVGMTLALLAIRQNVVVILFAAAAYVHLVWGDGQLTFLIEYLWLSLDNEVLLAIPMFLLAGAVMTRGSIAKRLIDLAVSVKRPIPGGLAVATILSCAVFAAISGSSPVTLLAVGAILFPALLQNGYDRKFSLGALTAGGTLGIIIPPSIPLILYGIVTEHSIADLFLAGVIPGLMIATALAFYSYWVNRHMPSEPFDASEFLSALRAGGWSMALPAFLLGGIYSGYFSPTEAAAVALIYALFVEIVIHRELKAVDFFHTAVETARLFGMLFPIVAVALSIKTLLTIEGAPQALAELVTSVTDDKITFLLAANLLLLLVGCLFDVISAILILAPLLLAPAMAYGIDPIHFGVIMVINLEIGFLTPPLGLNLIVAMTAFRAKFAEICLAALPFISIILAVLMIVSYVPETAMWLVR